MMSTDILIEFESLIQEPISISHFVHEGSVLGLGPGLGPGPGQGGGWGWGREGAGAGAGAGTGARGQGLWYLLAVGVSANCRVFTSVFSYPSNSNANVYFPELLNK